MLFTVQYQAIPHWKGKRIPFQNKKKIRSEETHNIPPQKNLKSIFFFLNRDALYFLRSKDVSRWICDKHQPPLSIQ